MTADPQSLRALAERTLALSAAATPGPWYLLTSETEVASEHGDGGPTVVVDTQFFYGPVTDRRRADAACIAHSRSAAPQLAEAVLALLEVVEAAEGITEHEPLFSDPEGLGAEQCLYCGGQRHPWDGTEFPHASDCDWDRLRAALARLAALGD